VGGVDAALRFSRAMDARNGLATERAVLERIYADLPPDEHVVSLDFSFHADPAAYERLARIAYERPIDLEAGAPRAYRLRLRPTRGGVRRDPSDAQEVPLLEIGPVALSRLVR
jgi:hypothetical protein